MKELFRFIKAYIKSNFDLRLYLAVGVLLIISLIFNYSLDFEDSYIDSYKGNPIRVLWFFLYEGIPFLLAAIIVSKFGAVPELWWKSKDFWTLFTVGFLILAMDRHFIMGELVWGYVPTSSKAFVYRVVNWLSGLLQLVLPLSLFYLLARRFSSVPFFGLTIRRFDPIPYLVLLLIAGVFIGVGSFFSDIQHYYPRYDARSGQAFADYFGLSQLAPLLIFEGAYGLDFISVELFFRGFLIYSMVRFFGPHVVLPMVVSYCFLHFGKPLTESVSSIFGGYILGIVALKNKNIWGGVMIHVGVAWLMELFGFLQK